MYRGNNTQGILKNGTPVQVTPKKQVANPPRQSRREQQQHESDVSSSSDSDDEAYFEAYLREQASRLSLNEGTKGGKKGKVKKVKKGVVPVPVAQQGTAGSPGFIPNERLSGKDNCVVM